MKATAFQHEPPEFAVIVKRTSHWLSSGQGPALGTVNEAGAEDVGRERRGKILRLGSLSLDGFGTIS